MKTKALLLILTLILLALPVLAQDTQKEEPHYNCPAFTNASSTERTSYYMGEGAAFMRSGNYGAAINSYGCIVQQIDSSYRDAYLNRAAAYVARREFDKALQDYNDAIRLDANFAASYNNRGVVYSATEDYERAVADFNHALNIDSHYIPSLINRGIVSAIQGDLDSAETDFQTVIDVAGLEAIISQLKDPEHDPNTAWPSFNTDAVRAYALLGTVHSQRALSAYNDYLLLTGGRADQRVQSAAGALQSRFQFELRFDDGTWMLLANFVEG